VSELIININVHEVSINIPDVGVRTIGQIVDGIIERDRTLGGGELYVIEGRKIGNKNEVEYDVPDGVWFIPELINLNFQPHEKSPTAQILNFIKPHLASETQDIITQREMWKQLGKRIGVMYRDQDDGYDTFILN
jgi:hypothetical protein